MYWNWWSTSCGKPNSAYIRLLRSTQPGHPLWLGVMNTDESWKINTMQCTSRKSALLQQKLGLASEIRISGASKFSVKVQSNKSLERWLVLKMTYYVSTGMLKPYSLTHYGYYLIFLIWMCEYIWGHYCDGLSRSTQQPISSQPGHLPCKSMQIPSRLTGRITQRAVTQSGCIWADSENRISSRRGWTMCISG